MDNLVPLLAPRSIAIVGASSDPSSLSGRPLHQLREFGFQGEIYPVNPNRSQVGGVRTYARPADLPEAVDLALIIVAAQHVLAALDECAARGISTAAIMSSGFAEQDEEGGRHEEAMRQIWRRSGIRILGPNCEGYLNLVDRVAATFSPAVAEVPPPIATNRPGLAVISQTGGLGFALLERGLPLGLPFSHVVSTGNEADLDLSEIGRYLVTDPHTSGFLLLLEGVRHPERFRLFLEAAQEANKIVLGVKLGTSDAGARGAMAHTAHRTGEFSAYDGLFRRYGGYLAPDEEGLLDMAMAFTRVDPSAIGALGVISTSGGAGVLLADSLEAAGLQVPTLSESTERKIRKVVRKRSGGLSRGIA